MVSAKWQALNVIEHKSIEEKALKLISLEVENFPEDERLNSLLEFMRTQLPPKAGEVMRLRFGEGKKYGEIAEELQISEVAVYKNLAQSLEKMKEHFNPNSDENKG